MADRTRRKVMPSTRFSRAAAKAPSVRAWTLGRWPRHISLIVELPTPEAFARAS